MERIYVGNAMYIQGSGLIDKLGEYTKPLGKNLLLLRMTLFQVCLILG
ncbi:MAG: hypothetical protein ACK5HS_03070 [Mycoplasmatales bacterium]